MKFYTVNGWGFSDLIVLGFSWTRFPSEVRVTVLNFTLIVAKD